MTSEIGILEEKKKRSCAGCKGKSNLWCNICRRRAAGKPRKKPGQKGYPKTLKVDETIIREFIMESLREGNEDVKKRKSSIASDVGHLALAGLGAAGDIGTLAGLPVGVAADLANAAWYAGEGDYLSAALSLVSAVPFAGDIVGKTGMVVGKLARTGKLAPIIKSASSAKNVRIAGIATRKSALAIKRAAETIVKNRAKIKAIILGARKHPKLAKYVDKMNAAMEDFIKTVVEALGVEPAEPAGEKETKNA